MLFFVSFSFSLHEVRLHDNSYSPSDINLVEIKSLNPERNLERRLKSVKAFQRWNSLAEKVFFKNTNSFLVFDSFLSKMSVLILNDILLFLIWHLPHQFRETFQKEYSRHRGHIFFLWRFLNIFLFDFLNRWIVEKAKGSILILILIRRSGTFETCFLGGNIWNLFFVVETF